MALVQKFMVVSTIVPLEERLNVAALSSGESSLLPSRELGRC
jgi:hypothetical protein